MKRSSCAIMVLCLTVLAAGPAWAELTATFINRTHFEIQYVGIRGDGGGMGSDIRVVPGNLCSFTDGNSSQLTDVSIDAGLMLFTFSDMEALAGIPEPVLELSFDADDRPHLTLVEKKTESDGNAFDLEAGPIWNNDHARQRCPEVLEEWLAANPGAGAEWTGAWVTTIVGEMSVCGMKGAGDGPAATPLLINVVGAVTRFADPAARSETDFITLAGAETMEEIRALGGRESPVWDSQLYLPVSFAGKTWAVFVDTGEDEAPGVFKMRAYTAGNTIQMTREALAALGYRPWFSQFSAGEDMDTTDMVKFWEESADAASAWNRVAELTESAHSSDGPAAVDVFLLSEEDYAKAKDGEDYKVPGFLLRVSNADVISLIFMTDVSMLISMVR